MTAFRNKKSGAAKPAEIASATRSASGSVAASSVKTASTAAARNRIEVAFSSNDEQSAWPSNDQQTYAFDETPSGKRVWLWALVFLVGLVGAFYLGLRASDWRSKNTSEPPLSEIAKQIKSAREALEKGDPATATNTLTGVVTREPQNAEARYWLGRAQLEQGEYVKARESFDEAIKVQAKVAEFYLYAAAAQKASGNKAKADEMLEQYVELRKVQQLTTQPHR
jgi:cytochrome c-type biogenesis protein CcmH/NrfG